MYILYLPHALSLSASASLSFLVPSLSAFTSLRLSGQQPPLAPGGYRLLLRGTAHTLALAGYLPICLAPHPHFLSSPSPGRYRGLLYLTYLPRYLLTSPVTLSDPGHGPRCLQPSRVAL
ncbi:hypothetical protein LX32DRAFT_110827 [Colletotrichum zoysiae]|uniref:Uncharacterized protein n=1 Tax=Colletotrichum zoysiae TaxID=1216348 RepID=A0AAD9LX13_9PEZI|nr:hypothetical protein LX32DRAFT_110827 [Colletotrichum zoysiae]